MNQFAARLGNIFSSGDMRTVRGLMVLVGLQWAVILWFPGLKVHVYGLPFSGAGLISIYANEVFVHVGWTVYTVAMIWRLGDATSRPALSASVNILGFFLSALWALSVFMQGNYPVPATTVAVAMFWVLVRTANHEPQHGT